MPLSGKLGQHMHQGKGKMYLLSSASTGVCGGVVGRKPEEGVLGQALMVGLTPGSIAGSSLFLGRLVPLQG